MSEEAREPQGTSEGEKPEETDEVERLRLENEELRKKADPKKRRTQRGFRAAIVVLLVALSAVAATLGATGLWLHQRVFNTDGWVQTVGSIPADPNVQDVLSARISDAVLAQLDIQSAVSTLLAEIPAEGLADKAQLLAVPITGAIESFIQKGIHEIIASDQFQEIWVTANSAVHERLIKILRGDSAAIQIEGGAVYLDLSAVAVQVQQKLVDAGLNLAGKITIPADLGQVKILESDQLSTVQSVFNRLDRWWWSMPLAVLILMAIALRLAKDRRRALFWFGAGTALVGATIGVGVRVTRNAITSGIADEQAKQAVIDTWKTVLTPLWRQISILIVLALLLAIVTAVIGPSPWAVKLRATVKRRSESWRERGVAEKEPVGLASFLQERRRPVEILCVAAAFLILLILPEPSVLSLLVIAGILLIVIAAVEFLAGPPPRAATAEDQGGMRT